MEELDDDDDPMNADASEAGDDGEAGIDGPLGSSSEEDGDAAHRRARQQMNRIVTPGMNPERPTVAYTDEMRAGVASGKRKAAMVADHLNKRIATTR